MPGLLPLTFALATLFAPESVVPISTKVSKDMFPPTWVSSPINATAVEVDPAEGARSLKIIEEGMKKYPASVLTKNLKKVYICKTIEFYGLSYGGTNDNTNVYLTNLGVAKGYTDTYIEEAFHHEFSSILLRNFPKSLDSKAWIAVNGDKGYKSNGTDALRDGEASLKYDPRYQELGFLAQYATASQEEDFNMFAGGIWTGRADFWAAVDRFPKIAAKMRLIVSFYHALDASIDEKRFRSLKRAF